MDAPYLSRFVVPISGLTLHCSSEHVNISIQIGWNRPELGGHFQIFWEEVMRSYNLPNSAV